MASNNPILVALALWLCGSLLAAIEIKTMLSIPRIISKKVSVKRAIMASLVNKKSNMEILKNYWSKLIKIVSVK